MGKSRRAMWKEREAVVRRFAASGLSGAEFCRRESIPYWKFQQWKARLGKQGTLAPARAGECSDVTSEPPRAEFAELVLARPSALSTEESERPGTRADNEDPQVTRPLIEIALPGGAVVRVYEGADASLVRAVAEAVARC